MLIAGAGNLGKHCLDMLLYDECEERISFFDDNPALPEHLYGRYPVLKTVEAVKEFFAAEGHSFIAAVGNNRMREKMVLRMEALGGRLVSLVSSRAYISPLLALSDSVIVQPGAALAHEICMGRSCTIHANAVIGHDVVMGNYVSVASLSTLIGPCLVGDYTFIGTNVVVHPGLRIGKNCYIGSGVVVREDLPDHGTLV
jgi:sugar O-acyltransferase (sialic acid O-acetyltransferase NeuD family)